MHSLVLYRLNASSINVRAVELLNECQCQLPHGVNRDGCPKPGKEMPNFHRLRQQTYHYLDVKGSYLPLYKVADTTL